MSKHIKHFNHGVSPRIFCSQLLFGGEEFDTVLQLKEAFLRRFIIHTLMLIKVLQSGKKLISNLRLTATTSDQKTSDSLTSAAASLKYFLFISGSQSKER